MGVKCFLGWQKVRWDAGTDCNSTWSPPFTTCKVMDRKPTLSTRWKTDLNSSGWAKRATGPPVTPCLPPARSSQDLPPFSPTSALYPEAPETQATLTPGPLLPGRQSREAEVSLCVSPLDTAPAQGGDWNPSLHHCHRNLVQVSTLQMPTFLQRTYQSNKQETTLKINNRFVQAFQGYFKKIIFPKTFVRNTRQ